MTKHPLFSILWLAFVAVSCVACKEPPAPERIAPPVTVAEPTKRVVEPYDEFTGETRATEYAEIRARVPGELQSILFEPATMVEEGQVLFEIEPETYQAAKDEAVANLASAESALANAEADLRRMSEAIQSRAVSQSDFDLAQAARDKALADVLTGRARLSQAEIDMGYTRVQAPIRGRVSRNLVDAGNLVGFSEPTLLTTVANVQPIFVYFDAPEDLVLRMLRARSDPAADEEELRRIRVATAADDGFPFVGRIDYIDNQVKSSTGTIELRALIENEDVALISGLFVRVRGLGGLAREVMLVQERAIGTDIGGKFVLIVGEGNVVEQRYVELGTPQDDGTIVVESGIELGESYILEGLLRARPGFPVSPESESEAAPQAASDQANDKAGP